MNVVDSSAWLEYFTNGPNADKFAPAIEDVSRLVVPSICLLEVFKKVFRERDESEALQIVAQMQQGLVQDLDVSIALSAARFGVEHNLPLADSVILAAARKYNAILWTQDADFEGIDGVRFFPKQSSSRKSTPGKHKN